MRDGSEGVPWRKLHTPTPRFPEPAAAFCPAPRFLRSAGTGSAAPPAGIPLAKRISSSVDAPATSDGFRADPALSEERGPAPVRRRNRWRPRSREPGRRSAPPPLGPAGRRTESLPSQEGGRVGRVARACGAFPEQTHAPGRARARARTHEGDGPPEGPTSPMRGKLPLPCFCAFPGQGNGGCAPRAAPGLPVSQCVL